MKFFLALVHYALIALLIIQNHIFFAVGVALLFSYWHNTVWLIPLGFVIDGYFGAYTTVPMFSISSIVWFFTVELARPKLRLGTTYE